MVTVAANPYRPGDLVRTSGVVRWRRWSWDFAGSFTDCHDPVLIIDVKDSNVFVLSSCGRTGWSHYEQFSPLIQDEK